jgi:chromosome segregation ATPase
MPVSESVQALRDRYQKFHDTLADAREKCAEPADRARLRELAEAIQDVLTALDQADMQSRTAEFEALSRQIGAANSDLERLKAEINTIVQDEKCAQKVVSAIDACLTASAKVF